MSCPEQYIEALALANQVRLDRSLSKRELRAGSLSVEQALTLSHWQTATVRSLLMALPRVGDRIANKLLSRAGIGPARLVRDLTERQSKALIAELPERLTGPKAEIA